MNKTLKFVALAGESLMTSFCRSCSEIHRGRTDRPQVSAFLAEINGAPFWGLPQAKPQDILTAFMAQAQ